MGYLLVFGSEVGAAEIFQAIVYILLISVIGALIGGLLDEIFHGG